MNEARLEIDREVILDRSGTPSYSGDIDVGPCWSIVINLLLFLEKQFETTDSLRLIPHHPHDTKCLK